MFVTSHFELQTLIILLYACLFESVSETDFENSAGATELEAPDTIVMDEAIDPNYVPGEEEVLEYVKWLGMDLDKDQDLFWIAREGLMAPLPQDWKPCRQKDTDEIYYFNFTTGESTWDHPCDGYYKRLYEEEKKKKEILIKVVIALLTYETLSTLVTCFHELIFLQQSGDQKRTRAKQDVDQLLGKSEKKKKKATDSLKLRELDGSSKGSSGSSGAKIGPLRSLERKPLPDITGKGSLSTPLSNAPIGIAQKPSFDNPPEAAAIPESNTNTKSRSSSKLIAAVSIADSTAAAAEQSSRHKPDSVRHNSSDDKYVFMLTLICQLQSTLFLFTILLSILSISHVQVGE